MSKNRKNDGRWLIGWLLRLVGGAIFVGLAIASIGILRKWGLEIPRSTIGTFGVLGLIGVFLLGIGQATMNAAPRSADDRKKENP